MNAKLDEPGVSPPVAPDDGEVAHGDSVFADECNAIATSLAGARWNLGIPLVTRSDMWGPVWRVDFEMPGVDLPARVNRIICWRSPEGHPRLTAFVGQDVPPLHASEVDPAEVLRRAESDALFEVELEALSPSVRKILLDEWDPIGIGNVSRAREEYEQYVGRVAVAILADRSVAELTEYLLWVEVKRMGLAGNKERARTVAEKLLKAADTARLPRSN